MTLVHFALQIATDDAMKVMKFQRGFCPSIRSHMSILRLNNFLAVVKIARITEHENDEL